ncbi:MAG: pyridoxamine 5'-phosphate oxidase family protein [Alphaproteobacteria bacterium]|nr:pyridoxamine 5'-phosphate oxidase family protein [Alphaproteobacteria bacterium]
MTDTLNDETDLRAIYAAPSDGAVRKEIATLDPHSKRFIALSPFLCIGTARPDGLADVSPRGGAPGFVHVLSDAELAMPDRPGNNRLDTLTNLTVAPSVGLLFFIPGFEDLLRVNGVARMTTAPALMERFIEHGKPPRSVMIVEVREVYLHCTKAIRRAGLWDPARFTARDAMPSAGQIYRDQIKLDAPAEAIDQMLEHNAKTELY